MTTQALTEKITQLALDKKATDITVMDLIGISDVADYFIILSGESDVHVKTLANHIERELKGEKIRAAHREGFNRLNWVLLDYIDVVVHIFRPETREYFALEKLWADAKITKVTDDATTGIIPE